MVIDNEIASGLFVGMTPATGVVAGLGDDGASKPLLGWDSVQGDTFHWAPAGSVGGGGTRRHLFDREVYVLISTGPDVYANVRAWTSITGKPTTVQGFGITNAVRTDADSTISAKLTLSPTVGTIALDISGGNGSTRDIVMSGQATLRVRNGANNATNFSVDDGGNATIRGTLTLSASLLYGTDNAFDVGSSSARVRMGYFTKITVGGSNPAAVGTILLPNDNVISWRNAGNTADFTLRFNSANTFAFDAPLSVAGNITASGTVIAPKHVAAAGSTLTLGANGNDYIVLSTSGILGINTTFTTSAAAGEIVLTNNRALRAVNAGGTDTAPLIYLDAGNVAQLAPTAAVKIAANGAQTTVGGLLQVLGTGGFSVGALASTGRITYGTAAVSTFAALNAGNGMADWRTGNSYPDSDNAFDIGTASLRYRFGYFSQAVSSGQFIAPSFATASSGTAMTIANGGSTVGTWDTSSLVMNTGLNMKGFTLNFDQVGTRSWSMIATGGNLSFNSGDGFGLFLMNMPFGNGGSIGAQDGARATITSTAGHTCYQAWNQATSSDNVFITFYTEGGSGSLRGKIDYNRAGGVTRYNTSSDGTLKTILGDADVNESLAILRGTRLRSFFWNDDETRKPQIGPIAQELYQIFKGAVTVGGMRKSARGEDGKEIDVYEPWAVDKTAFAWHLVAGWQDHDDRLARIERALAARDIALN